MANALRFRQADVPRQPGERARIKVIQGPDQGCIYVLTNALVSIGRGDENDIVLTDLKSSRKHAAFVFEEGSWYVKDTGSANGIGHQGHQVRAAKLGVTDHLTLGETMIEFIYPEMGTRVLVAPPKEAARVRADEAALGVQRARVRALGKSRPVSKVVNANPIPSSQKGKGKLVIPLAIVLAVLAFYGNEGSNKGKKKRPVKTTSESAVPHRDLASYVDDIPGTPESENASRMFFKAGFREYREKNFLRAKLSFENALQVSPGHKLAQIYLDKSLQGISEEVLFHLEQGKRGYAAGKTRSAKAHYEAILRLLYREPASPKFIEAKDQLERIDGELSPGGKAS